MLADGGVFGNFPGPYPEPLLRAARGRLQRGLLPDRRFGRGGPGGRRSGPGAMPPPPEPIVVQGEMAGVVVVLPRAPFWFLLRRYGSTLAVVALAALASGAILAAVLIFGPARRRLRAVAAAFNAMADDLAARADALAAADRTRRQLLADVSHELTTPVTAMRGYLETLSMPELAVDADTRARYLAIIGDETARLEQIIGDLLDLAKLEGGGGAFTMEAVPVADLLARVAARHERDAATAGVAITQRIEPDGLTIWGDRGRLEQALQNLAANALRYAPRGTAIELRATQLGDGMAMSVVDHGTGIPAEHLPHIFDRFYKADSARTSSAGSGLGLSIVKAIIERHGGTVTVASVPGRTEFELWLPARDARSTASRERAEGAP
jgi:signal transduction histidine kinase